MNAKSVDFFQISSVFFVYIVDWYKTFKLVFSHICRIGKYKFILVKCIFVYSYRLEKKTREGPVRTFTHSTSVLIPSSWGQLPWRRLCIQNVENKMLSPLLLLTSIIHHDKTHSFRSCADYFGIIRYSCPLANFQMVVCWPTTMSTIRDVTITGWRRRWIMAALTGVFYKQILSFSKGLWYSKMANYIVITLWYRFSSTL